MFQNTNIKLLFKWCCSLLFVSFIYIHTVQHGVNGQSEEDCARMFYGPKLSQNDLLQMHKQSGHKSISLQTLTAFSTRGTPLSH